MSEFSELNRPALTIIGEDPDPQSPLNPAADFLLLANQRHSNILLQTTLEQPGTPKAAVDLYRRHENCSAVATPHATTLAIGKLLTASSAGKLLDFDNETWGHIAQDPPFRAARTAFNASNDRQPEFIDLRYAMTGRMLAIFCLRTQNFLKHEPELPFKNTA